MSSFNSHSDESIRTTSAAYLLAVGHLALSEFAALRGIDASTLSAMQKEAVEAWAEKWGCDVSRVLSEAVVVLHHLRSFVVQLPGEQSAPWLHA